MEQFLPNRKNTPTCNMHVVDFPRDIGVVTKLLSVNLDALSDIPKPNLQSYSENTTGG